VWRSKADVGITCAWIEQFWYLDHASRGAASPLQPHPLWWRQKVGCSCGLTGVIKQSLLERASGLVLISQSSRLR